MDLLDAAALLELDLEVEAGLSAVLLPKFVFELVVELVPGFALAFSWAVAKGPKQIKLAITSRVKIGVFMQTF